MENKENKEFYEFAFFRLDVKQCRLTCSGETISLTPKEFDVLLYLIENSNRVIEKDELLDAVWKDTFVEEATLTRNISWLRKKLAARTGEKIIETLPKRGYRFLPEVTNGGANLAVIAEQTIRQIEIEEIIEFEPSEFAGDISDAEPRETVKYLPAAPKNRFAPLLISSAVLIAAVLGVFAYRGYFAPPPKIVPLSRIAPFSGLPGRETSPAFSPDGKQLAFAWDGGVDGGNFDIYVKLIGAGEPVRLTQTAADEINPVFAPDGKSIAFVRVSPAHNEIVLIPALGGAERKLYENASYASLSFSPDGKTLAAAELDSSGNEAGIFTINLQTGEKTKLTAPESPAIDHTPRFAPDGKSLAFIRYFSSFKREVFVVSTEGGEPRQITSDDARLYSLAWSADGESLFFTSFRAGNQLNLWRVPADANSEPQMITAGSKNLQDLAISPNGKTLAFAEETADANIWEIEPGKPPRPLIRSSRDDHSQQFSPDGTQIVFVSERTENYEIWIADADGKNQRQITDSNGSAGSPRFSPDGKTIAFDAQTSGSSDVYTIAVSGGTPARLTDGGKNNSLPVWGADGRTIFFLSNRSGADQIWKIPAGGGEAVQITKQGAFEMFAASDGKTLICSKGGGKNGLRQIGTDGGSEISLPELAGIGAWRSWSAAANGVYFTTFETQPPFHIRFFDFATRQIKPIADVKKPPLDYYSNLAVSPDGKKILYAQRDQSASSIMLAEINEDN